MLEKILTFVTPGPITENFRFNVRVLYSWISLGLVIDVIVAIIALSSGSSFDVQVLIAVPIVVCIFGLVGLGLDSLRGRNDKHPGWYWWLFPIITYLVMGFWLCFAIFGMSLAMVGIRLPKFQQSHKPRYKKPNQKIPNKIKEEIEKKTSEELLKEYEKKLIHQQEEQLKRLEREQIKEEEKKEIREFLSIREQILLKLRENPGARPKDILTEEEMEELATMLFESIF
ncbi:US12 family protein [Trichormus sp. NMC-1]|uniref:US12 family protein n=1 Tax=Trichormus sp. NMC-1 TaxID=1853259 RepID=UPI0008DC281C|nr:US12 family protein [Trichormus sp. NMC-1]